MTAPRSPLLGFHEGRLAAVRMRELRRAAGFSQDELAAMICQSPSWVSARERGASRLSVGDAEKIAQVLGTDLAGLTTEQEEP